MVSAIEPLEARIAPATLVNPMTVTYEGKNGDAVTVSISKPLFTTASAAKVFKFDTGSVNGSNSTDQQLEALNITQLGAAAVGINISITAKSGANPGTVNVGYINASDLDLGNVTVGGDLGRIAAGDMNYSNPGLASLTVGSLGAQGLTTQAAGGNLTTLLSGSVGSITVNGDIDGASIGVGGGVHGFLGSLLITGNINGGAAAYSGSVRTQGGITKAEVDGSIIGGGANSGLIGTSGALGTLLVKGSVTGGPGDFSGAILATGAISSVEIDGDLTGGSGPNSGQVGTASTLGTVTVEESVTGGAGPLSGTILATGNIGSVLIDLWLTGGAGTGSGQIGSAASIGTVTMHDSMFAGAIIHAHENIGSISVGVPFNGGQIIYGGDGINNSTIAADDGSIGSITSDAIGASFTINPMTYLSGGLYHDSITAGGSIGSIQTSVTIAGPFGIIGTDITAASIGSLTASSAGAAAICASHIQTTGGIGPVTATGSGDAILNSGFDAGGSIGAINSNGSVVGSVFIAGIDLGAKFAVSGAGGFTNAIATGLGFGAAVGSSLAAHIASINVTNGLIQQTTLLSGVHGKGADGIYGTKDDTVVPGSSINAVHSENGLVNVFVESGDIGPTTAAEIIGSTYIATDTAVAGGGIGPIMIPGPSAPALFKVAVSLDSGPTVTSQAISNSTFISDGNIGNIGVTVSGARGSGINAAIANTLFQAGHALGQINVTDALTGAAGSNYGIYKSTFNGGLDGYGAAADINVSLTATGSNGNSAAIADSDFDASVCACMSANMGNISVSNADSAATAAGILDTVFRVHGNIGPISAVMNAGSPTAAAIEGATFSAFGSIGNVYTYGAVVADSKGPSRFLAGYDIGTDMTFGNEDLSAKSLALQSGQSIGKVTVTGYFSGSDIAASINPGADYVLGDSIAGTSANNNSNIGTGGTIGVVSIGGNVSMDTSPFNADHATQHAIEAASIGAVTAFGYTGALPTVLYTGGGPGDVRIAEV